MDEIVLIVAELIKSFVTEPNEVKTHLSEMQDERGTVQVINVKVAKSDIGVCIGEDGKTAEALRRIIGLVGFKKLDRRVYVKIDAPRFPKSHFNYT